MRSRFVIVGASLAGMRAAEALRRLGFSGELMLIGEESHLPYDRPPLSKQVLLGTWPPEQVRFRRKDGFDGLQLTMRLGARAVALRGTERQLQLADGEVIAFDGLVIATGARPRRLSGSPPEQGVYVLRTLDDALALRAALTHGTPRVAVVGGGFIGLEVASVCRTLGLPVTVIEQDPVPLARIIGEAMGEALCDLHRAHGVVFETGVAVSGLLGEARVRGVALEDGRTLPADVVVLGLGVIPCTAWLSGSGVEVRDGVVCDDRCATALPQIVAAGDVARFYNPRFGVEQRVEHWTHAVEMAHHAANRLLSGPDVPVFAPVPYFWSDQYDVKVQFTGHAGPGMVATLTEGSVESGKLTVVFEHDGVLRGALAWNSPAKLMALRREIAAAPLQPARTP